MFYHVAHVSSIILIVFLSGFVLTPAWAITVDLADANAASGLTDGATYATVQYGDVGLNDVSFSLQVNTSILPPSKRFGINQFYFTSDIPLAVPDIACTGCIILFNKSSGDFGTFGVKLTFTPRADPTSFTITHEGLSSADFVSNASDEQFAVGVAGFRIRSATGVIDHGVFAGVAESPPTSIPEPTTLLLVCSGLVTAAFARRRRLFPRR